MFTFFKSNYCKYFVIDSYLILGYLVWTLATIFFSRKSDIFFFRGQVLSKSVNIGEKGVKIAKNSVHVVCTCPLMYLNDYGIKLPEFVAVW